MTNDKRQTISVRRQIHRKVIPLLKKPYSKVPDPLFTMTLFITVSCKYKRWFISIDYDLVACLRLSYEHWHPATWPHRSHHEKRRISIYGDDDFTVSSSVLSIRNNLIYLKILIYIFLSSFQAWFRWQGLCIKVFLWSIQKYNTK